MAHDFSPANTAHSIDPPAGILVNGDWPELMTEETARRTQRQYQRQLRRQTRAISSSSPAQDDRRGRREEPGRLILRLCGRHRTGGLHLPTPPPTPPSEASPSRSRTGPIPFLNLQSAYPSPTPPACRPRLTLRPPRLTLHNFPQLPRANLLRRGVHVSEMDEEKYPALLMEGEAGILSAQQEHIWRQIHWDAPPRDEGLDPPPVYSESLPEGHGRVSARNLRYRFEEEENAVDLVEENAT